MSKLIEVLINLVKRLKSLWASVPEEDKKQAIELAAKMLRKFWAAKYDEAKGSKAAGSSSEKVDVS